MNTKQNQLADYSGNFSETTTTGAGAGGLASMAQAFAVACGSGSKVGQGQPTTTTGAGARCLGIEAMRLGDALASRETAAAPMMRFIQLELDERIVQRSAYKLRARMAGDGREVSADDLQEAIQAARVAVVLWRQGVAVTRDDGQDLLGAGGDFEKHVARVAWRALVAALSSDSVGTTIQIVGGADDDWLCPLMLPGESRAERIARQRIAMRAGRRQMELIGKMHAVSAGRGRRKEAAEKVGNALGLLLAGETLDTAASSAGFKPRGRHPAGDSLLRAAKRLGLIGDGFTIPRRGR